jgi:phosphoribosylformimino-5-aminoimidazole carboxamide ribotide isomerase
MLIPSIDIMGGRIVQLEQGSRLVYESADLDGWIARFSRFQIVQLIDLDAAMNRGDNAAVIAHVCQRLPCQVGGGVRTPERARSLTDSGARRVIVGSALYGADGVNIDAARAFQLAVGDANWIAAIDARGERVVVNGWTSQTQVSPAAAIQALETYTCEFLYTNVDREGLLQGFDMSRAQQLRATTTRHLVVAGGIRSQHEIDELDRMGVDSVVGMAVYRGLLPVTSG